MVMAGQGEGWPMGLHPVSRIRVGFARNHEFSAGSVSFNALLTSSPTSSDYSSDLDTESTGSFFHDRSITLGRLIGASVMLDFSRRSMRSRNRKPAAMERKKDGKARTRPCLFSLCLGEDSINVESGNIDNAVAASSLGHFLAVERKAVAHGNRRGLIPPMYGPDEMAIEQAASRSLNSLFIDGLIAPPPRTSPGTAPQVNRGCESGIGAVFCCVCMK